jgi:DNA-binding transcriptional LysR family regulator
MKIDDLAGFAAVARTGSFSRAAELTHRSQPAVSLQVARLERELGVRLLDRAGRAVRLTREGEAVRSLAEEILDRVRRIGTGAEARGRLVVGAGHDAARRFLPHALRTFRRRFPQVETVVRTDPSRSLVEHVAAGRVDLAILTQPLAAVGVAERPLRRYGFVAVGSDLRAPLILPEAGSVTRVHIESSLLKAGIVPRVAMETSSLPLAVAMARAGAGTAIVPSFAVGGRRIDRWVPPQTLCLAWRAGTTDLPRDELADLIRIAAR